MFCGDGFSIVWAAERPPPRSGSWWCTVRQRPPWRTCPRRSAGRSGPPPSCSRCTTCPVSPGIPGVGCLDLTDLLLILALTFQSRHLGLREHQAFLGGFLLRAARRSRTVRRPWRSDTARTPVGGRGYCVSGARSGREPGRPRDSPAQRPALPPPKITAAQAVTATPCAVRIRRSPAEKSAPHPRSTPRFREVGPSAGAEHGLHGRLEFRHIPRHSSQAMDLRGCGNERIHGAYGTVARFAAGEYPSPLVGDRPVHSCDSCLKPGGRSLRSSSARPGGWMRGMCRPGPTRVPLPRRPFKPFRETPGRFFDETGSSLSRPALRRYADASLRESLTLQYLRRR